MNSFNSRSLLTVRNTTPAYSTAATASPIELVINAASWEHSLALPDQHSVCRLWCILGPLRRVFLTSNDASGDEIFALTYVNRSAQGAFSVAGLQHRTDFHWSDRITSPVRRPYAS